jgi:diaminohydroxyphosphoribosylaminopyrimidine deaminase / 5-amino-6-(5-phosphoribosylamino)uracil reductase
MQLDEKNAIMEDVLKLALKGRTSPNPRVGCIIMKNGSVIGRGYHKKAGLEHAEIVALRKAGVKASGGEMWINLEPCCHTGKTGPCVKAIVDSGIKEVNIAMKDPNPKVNGKGIKFLEKKGVKVNVGILEKEAMRINEWYVKHITTSLPFVIMKIAMTMDEKITCPGERYITCKESLKFVHKVRNSVDAIMVGLNTVKVDDPHLTCRLKGNNCSDPLRIILDSRLEIPMNSKVLKDRNVVIATTTVKKNKELVKKKNELVRKGVDVIEVNPGNKVNISKLLKLLGKKGITSILVEGGQKLNTELLNKSIPDKVIFFISPRSVGKGLDFMVDKKIIHLKNEKTESIGHDIMVEGYL